MKDAPKLPAFDVRIPPPDLTCWRAGNTGTEGVWRFAAAAPGPHLVMVSLIHGNEYAGAIVIADLLRAGFRPSRGCVTFVFANLAAFDRFDPDMPTASRFVDEDMNRVWDVHLLEGGRRTVEAERARALLPVILAADAVLDLHTMLWQDEPMLLAGASRKGCAFARALGATELIVTDHGHASGPRLIDAAPFVDEADPRVAVLLEAGRHWEASAVETARGVVTCALRHLGLAGADHPALPEPPPAVTPRVAQVTHAITAATDAFAFVDAWQGVASVPRRNTLIALDGEAEIRTPYDDCLLVMPSLRPTRGHTAVRLARLTT